VVSHGDSQLGGCEFEPEHHILLGEMLANLPITLKKIGKKLAKWIRPKNEI
jgi:hypothetical protein